MLNHHHIQNKLPPGLLDNLKQSYKSLLYSSIYDTNVHTRRVLVSPFSLMQSTLGNRWFLNSQVHMAAHWLLDWVNSTETLQTQTTHSSKCYVQPSCQTSCLSDRSNSGFLPCHSSAFLCSSAEGPGGSQKDIQRNARRGRTQENVFQRSAFNVL